MKKIYIASPYTIGDTAVNVHTSLEAADAVIRMGAAPFAPLLSHFQHMMFPQHYQVWIDLDIVWVESCDALLRLPGESSGADGELAHAQAMGIPVFHTLEELKAWLNPEDYHGDN